MLQVLVFKGEMNIFTRTKILISVRNKITVFWDVGRAVW